MLTKLSSKKFETLATIAGSPPVCGGEA